MAYNIKYKVVMATKSNDISYLYLLENDYVGSIIEYPAVNIELQYLPKSDDVFETIYASQLSVTIDVTDDISNMPDFTQLDDRKYLVKLYNNDTDLEWQGWTLSDNVQFSFTTGRRTLAFNAIDGLGMLDKITYTIPSDESLMTKKTALSFVNDALSKIAFPTNLNVISGISFFADGMANRTDDTDNEPLIQTYLHNISFKDLNYLEILTNILSGFTCRISQAKGLWYIVPITQFAQEEYYYTRYNGTTVVSSGLLNDNGLIEGYSSNTSGLFFTDNSQFKILRKGYNKVLFEKIAEYLDNYTSNSGFKNITGGNPNFWTLNNNAYGSTSIKINPTSDYNAAVLSINKTTSGVAYAGIYTAELPKINVGDSGVFTFNCSLTSFSVTPLALVTVKVLLFDGVNTYYVNDSGSWSVMGSGQPYFKEDFDANNTVKDVSVTIPNTLFAGTLSIEILNTRSDSSTSAQQTIEVQNPQLKLTSIYKGVTIYSELNSANEYVYKANLGSGFNSSSPLYNYYRGYFSDSTGEYLTNWYRQENPTELYASCAELGIKQYSNVLSRNIINIDGTFMGMNTENGRFSEAMRIRATDTDPAQISVQDKKYILGNTTINLFNDEIRTTLLEITNINNDATVVANYNITKIRTDNEFFAHARSEGYATRYEAEAASVTTDVIFLDTPNLNPPINTIWYANEELTVPFDGAFLWYKLEMDTETHVYLISSEGEIIEIYI